MFENFKSYGAFDVAFYKNRANSCAKNWSSMIALILSGLPRRNRTSLASKLLRGTLANVRSEQVWKRQPVLCYPVKAVVQLTWSIKGPSTCSTFLRSIGFTSRKMGGAGLEKNEVAYRRNAWRWKFDRIPRWSLMRLVTARQSNKAQFNPH